MNSNKKNVRNLIIFVIAINVVGWLAFFIAQGAGTPNAQGLGLLVWLISPFLVSILLRLFSKDWQDIGVKPNFKGNGRYYLFSIFIFPIIIAVVLLTGWLFGSTSFTNFNLGLFLTALVISFTTNFVKNIFEEFAWRGYLTPKIYKTGLHTIAGHLLVGFIWATYHLPYYLGLLDRTQFAAYTSLSLAVYLPLAIIGMTVAGILFGEIRLITGSTWPAVLMHTMSNALILTLLMEGLVDVSGSEFLFTPSWEGILSMVLIILAGLWLYRQRVKKALLEVKEAPAS